MNFRNTCSCFPDFLKMHSGIFSICLILSSFLSVCAQNLLTDSLPELSGSRVIESQLSDTGTEKDGSISHSSVFSVLSKDTVSGNDSNKLIIEESLFPYSSLKRYDTIVVDTIEKKAKVVDNVRTERRVRRNEKRLDVLYPGITHEQDKLASQIIRYVYAYDWEDAEKAALKMHNLEEREKLPPLSYLLRVSLRIVRIQNGEFVSDKAESKMYEEISSIVDKGLQLSNPEKAPDNELATYLLVYSGIKGFSATLKISRKPVEAAIEGFGALKLLEKLNAMDSQINDVYLGLGIFYCALAKAPSIVRGVLNVAGRNVTFDKGLDYLRLSAYSGKYTNDMAKQYLIQFLSPYYGHLKIEKDKIFKTLQIAYPRNPYYTFLEINENICFHKDRLTQEYFQKIKKKISKFRGDDYSVKRYEALVMYQYAFLDSTSTFRPDTTIDLREMSFYPVFLNAISEKEQKGRKVERFMHLRWTKSGALSARMLNESSMSSNRKNFFSWCIRDALREDD
jgi:hypothetical protein